MTFVPVDELSEVFHHALGKRVISPVPLGDQSKASNVVPLRPRSAQAKRRNGAMKRRTDRKRRDQAITARPFGLCLTVKQGSGTIGGHASRRVGG